MKPVIPKEVCEYIKHGKRVTFQCFWCARCCANLSLIDRIIISFQLRSLILKRKCKLLNDNRCSIYSKRPQFCVEWQCGITYEG